MFSRIRKRFTYANVIMTLALVFAMTGGAYAAKRYLITSTSQISPKVLKTLQGKAGKNGAPGSAGPAGPAGPAGAKGDNGPAGSAGSAGAKGGVGPAGSTGPAGAAGAKGEEGEEGPEGPAGLKGSAGPTGPEGSPWTVDGTLPSGKTETGVWGGAGMPVKVFGIFEGAVATISFTIPLKEGLLTENHQVHVIGPGGKGEGKFEPGNEGENTGCPVTSEVTKPEAEPGNLCIFTAFQENITRSDPFSLEVFEEGAGKTGSLLVLVANNVAESVGAQGTWAVTAQ